MLQAKRVLLTVILISSLTVITSVFAQPSVIPYNGRLEQDGQLVTDAMRRDLAFFIVNDENANVPNHENIGGALLWSEEHINVPIAHGNFSVLLGEETQFNLSIFSQNPMLFLGVKVREQGGAWVELGGPGERQRLVSVPFALVAQTAKEANDFTVRGNETVQGTLDVLGAINSNRQTTLGATTVNGQLVANNSRTNLNAGATIIGGNDSSGGGSEGVLKVSRNNNSLVIDEDEIDASGPLNIQTNNHNGIKQPTVIGGDLTVNGNFTNLTVESEGPDGEFNLISSINLGIARARLLGSTTNRICFLSRVKIRAMDNQNEWAECRVATNNNNWYLYYHVVSNQAVAAECSAKCLSW